MAERRRSSQGKRSGGTSRRSSATRSSRSTARTAAARKGGQARGRQQRARSQARRTAAAATKPAERLEISAKTVAEFRDMLRKNLIRPLDLVMLTRDRIEELTNDAVERGRMTAADAQD